MGVFQEELNNPNLGPGISLRQFLRVLVKRYKLIVGLTVLCILGAGLISFYVLTPVYEAQTLLMVTVASEKLQTQATISTQVNKTDQGTTKTTTMPVLTMNTYLGQLESEEVMKRVLDDVYLPGQTIASLSSMIDASIVPDSNLINLKVQNKDPVKAAQIANSVSAQYLKLMNELMFSSVVVISPANVPANPISPKKMLNMEIAFVLGLMVSVLLAFLLESMDNTLKTAEDVNRIFNLPVLGLIPARNARNVRGNA